jgi:hypothetical protein
VSVSLISLSTPSHNPQIRDLRTVVVGLVLLFTSASIVAVPSTAFSITGTAAQNISVQESAHLRLISRQGTRVFNERGNMSGSIPGTLTMQMNIAHYGRAAINFSLSAKTGTLAGRGEASFYAAGNTAYFTGLLSITHGSRAYAHAAARGLRIQGTFQRNTFAVYVTVTGKLST